MHIAPLSTIIIIFTLLHYIIITFSEKVNTKSEKLSQKVLTHA
nr:MAG TPA: hypothetical protein [Caudoviricetes sp.]